MNNINSALILGSTSETAREISLQLAKNGCKKFHLLARNQANNEKLILELKNNFFVEVTSEIIDLKNNINPSKNLYKNYDLYIIASGYLGSKTKNKNLEEELNIINLNFSSLIPWLKAIVTEERINKKGCLWIFSSIAGDIGRPSNYQYGAAKAGLTIYCEGLSNLCSGKPFSIRILKAGLIDTKMSRGTSPKFLFTSPNQIAKYLLKNPFKNGIEYIPFWWHIVILILKLVPSFIIKRL